MIATLGDVVPNQDDWEEISRRDRLSRAVDHILSLPDPAPEERLRNAAPDLLKAAEAAIDCIDVGMFPDEAMALREAIAKAKGES